MGSKSLSIHTEGACTVLQANDRHTKLQLVQLTLLRVLLP